MLNQSLSKAAIARPVGVNRCAIRRWIAGGDLNHDVQTGEIPRLRPPEPGPEARAKPLVDARLESYPGLTVVRPFEEPRRRVKTLRDFHFGFQPSLRLEQLESLATLGFVECRENVVFVGSSGVGKTHLGHRTGHRRQQGGRWVYYGALADRIARDDWRGGRRRRARRDQAPAFVLRGAPVHDGSTAGAGTDLDA